MAWPPPALPTTRANDTPQLDTHPADHNAVNLAVNDIVARLNVIPAKIRASAVTATTNASGVVTLTHTLGTVPDVVFAFPASSNISQLNLSTATAANVTLRCFGATGAPVVSASVTVNLLVIDNVA